MMQTFLRWVIVILQLSLQQVIGIENLAVRKTANQSSLFGGNSAFGANLAVDDDLNPYYPNIACTNYEKDVYWYVNLDRPRNIQKVTIYYRQDRDTSYNNGYKQDFSGFNLYISSSGFITKGGYKCTVDSTFPPLLYSIPCARVGQYVTIYNHRDDGRSILQLGEVQVSGCSNPNEYGADCSFRCHDNCLNRWCNINNGYCFSCNQGYMGSFCNQTCPDGTYGADCLNKCSENCVNPSNCDRVNGRCTGGCEFGWKGELCDEICEEGKYGPNCSDACGNCESGLTCDRVTGHCVSCKPGYYPPFCAEKCSNGSYGLNCSQLCTWNCVNNETCNSDNGFCPNSCSNGWRNPICSEECLPGFYGQGCLSNCSNNCKNDEHCHHITGRCNLGCKDRFYGLRCFEECSKNCKNESICNPHSGFCDLGCKSGFFGSTCSLTCISNCKNNAVCVAEGACKEIENTNVVLIAGGCGAGAALVVIFVVVILFIRRRKPKKESSNSDNPGSVNYQQNGQQDLHKSKEGNNSDLHSKISIDDLEQLISDMSEDGNARFITQHEKLRSLIPQYEQSEYNAGRDNIDANFTQQVIPDAKYLWDRKIKAMQRCTCLGTRKIPLIKLDMILLAVDKFRCILKPRGKGKGDYYNAVFIQSYDTKSGLICAQFPLMSQSEDFLRLLHDFESHIVVSLEPLREIESTNKWMPANQSSLRAGDFSIRLDSEPGIRSSVTSTKISLNRKGYDEHEIEVFESASWNIKDARSSDLTCLLNLVTQVQESHKSKKPESIITILSKDGASKCDVFCAVYNALQQVHMNGEVDIFTIVRQMQIRRPEMFSYMDEYQFCFKVVAEYQRLEGLYLEVSENNSQFENPPFSISFNVAEDNLMVQNL